MGQGDGMCVGGKAHRKHGKHSARNYCMPNGCVYHRAINTAVFGMRGIYTRKWKVSSDVMEGSLKIPRGKFTNLR